jgi:hypothetical protein
MLERQHDIHNITKGTLVQWHVDMLVRCSLQFVVVKQPITLYNIIRGHEGVFP